MPYYRIVMSDELEHHGILGQKWGKRNGPPYPLDANDHSSAEKKAGWKKSLNSDIDENQNNSKKGLTDKQKKILKTVLTTAAGIAISYAGYKLATNPSVRGAVAKSLTKIGKKTIDEVDDIGPEIFSKKLGRYLTADEISKLLPGDLGGDCNPFHKMNNCKDVADAVVQRWTGANVSAIAGEKSMIGNLHDWVETKYNQQGIKWINDLGGIMPDTNGDSTEKVKKAILKTFRDGDCGMIGVSFNMTTKQKSILESMGISESGHAFNWYINKGDVIFYDDQPITTLIGKACSDKHLTRLDPRKEIEIVKLTKEAFAK